MDKRAWQRLQKVWKDAKVLMQKVLCRRERIFWKTDSGRSVGSEGDAAGRRVQFAPIDSGLRYSSLCSRTYHHYPLPHKRTHVHAKAAGC